MRIENRIIVALDVDTLEEASRIKGLLGAHAWCCKVGLQLILRFGIDNLIKALGPNLFVDAKIHDIPNTVMQSAHQIGRHPVIMFNVHASAGIDAMKAAVKVKGSAILLAVTILTSISEAECLRIFNKTPKEKAIDFAMDALTAGCDGIICSPEELPVICAKPELSRLLKITPGVRPLWAAANDQKRIMTPAQAILAGANALVIGRPITNPPSEVGTPLDAIKRIQDEIASVR